MTTWHIVHIGIFHRGTQNTIDNIPTFIRDYVKKGQRYMKSTVLVLATPVSDYLPIWCDFPWIKTNNCYISIDHNVTFVAAVTAITTIFIVSINRWQTGVMSWHFSTVYVWHLVWLKCLCRRFTYEQTKKQIQRHARTRKHTRAHIYKHAHTPTYIHPL